MAGEIVQDDNIAVLKDGDQAFADPCVEGYTIDGAVYHPRGDDLIVSKACNEGKCFPVAKRRFGVQGLTPWRPSPCAGHVGLDACFIDKDEPCSIYFMLMGFPLRSAACHFRAVLLAGHQRFF